MDPKSLSLKGLRGTAMAGSVVLAPGTNLGIEVTGVKSLKGQVEITGYEKLEDGSYRVDVRAAEAQMPGMLRDMIEFEIVTSDGVTRNTSMPVMVNHMDRISVAPPGNIVFQRRETQTLEAENATPLRRDVQVYSSAPDIHFNVVGVELLDVPEGVFETSLRTVKEGERYVVSIFVHEYRTEPSIRGRLKILTDDAETPEKEVRLYAQFGAMPQRPQPTAGQPVPRTRPGAGSVQKRAGASTLTPGLQKGSSQLGTDPSAQDRVASPSDAEKMRRKAEIERQHREEAERVAAEKRAAAEKAMREKKVGDGSGTSPKQPGDTPR